MLRNLLLAAATLFLFANSFCQYSKTTDSSHIIYKTLHVYLKVDTTKQPYYIYLWKNNGVKLDSIGRFGLSKKSSPLFKNDKDSNAFVAIMAKLIVDSTVRHELLDSILNNAKSIRSNKFYYTNTASKVRPVDTTGTQTDTTDLNNGGNSTSIGKVADLGLETWLIIAGITLAIGSLIYWLVLIIKSKKRSKFGVSQEHAQTIPITNEKHDDLQNGDQVKEVDQEDLVKMKREKQKLEVELKKKENELTQWKTKVESRANEIYRLQQTIESRNNEVNALKQTIDGNTKQLFNQEQTISKNNNEIAGLKKTIAERDDRIALLDNKLKEKEEERREFEDLSKELISKYYDNTFSSLRRNEIEGAVQQQMLLSNLLTLSIHAASLMRKSIGRAASSDIDNLELLKGKYIKPKGKVTEHSPQYSCDEMAYAVFQLIREHGVHKLDNVLVHGFKIGE